MMHDMQNDLMESIYMMMHKPDGPCWRIEQIWGITAGNNNNDNEFHDLWKFQRNNPPIFKGTHEPDKERV